MKRYLKGKEVLILAPSLYAYCTNKQLKYNVRTRHIYANLQGSIIHKDILKMKFAYVKDRLYQSNTKEYTPKGHLMKRFLRI